MSREETEQIRAACLAVMADLGLSITSEFIPWSRSRNADEKWPSLNWRVTLRRGERVVLTTDYSAGMAHAPSYKQSMTTDDLAAVKWECEHGKACRITSFGTPYPRSPVRMIEPNAMDVLHGLLLDAEVLDSPTYEDWADNFGYDKDSRRGEALYRACLKIALKLRAGIGEEGISKLRASLEGY